MAFHCTGQLTDHCHPEQWLPAVAGGKVPKFKKPAHEEAYTALMLRYASQVAEELGTTSITSSRCSRKVKARQARWS